MAYSKQGFKDRVWDAYGTILEKGTLLRAEHLEKIEDALMELFEIAADAPVQSVNGKTGAVTLAASDVGARPITWTPTYTDVGADKSGAAVSAFSGHNTNAEAHNDIRLLISGLASRLDALANSDDTTLDQMAELVAYIKNNKSLIDGITTSKVSVSDIINNLTTNVANKPLSAAQGVALKALIDALGENKLDAASLPEAISAALAQAKASGEFKGEKGDPGATGPAYTLTSSDKSSIAAAVKASLTTESWTFTLEDDSAVTKAVYVG